MSKHIAMQDCAKRYAHLGKVWFADVPSLHTASHTAHCIPHTLDYPSLQPGLHVASACKEGPTKSSSAFPVGSAKQGNVLRSKYMLYSFINWRMLLCMQITPD